MHKYKRAFFYGRGNWCFTVREERRLRVFENGVLRMILGLSGRRSNRRPDSIAS